MPEELRKANGIRYHIAEKADVGCGDEETDKVTGIIDNGVNDGSGTANAGQLSTSKVD